MAAENLFSCLTPFSETYELRGYILMDIKRMEWIACVACLSGNWSRLLLKSKVLWWWSKHGLCGVALCNVYLACFTPGMNQKRETDLREDLRFFLARSGVSGFTRPDEFDLCGCCCCEAPRIDRSFSNRWSHLVARLRPIGRRNACSGFKFNPHRWTGPEDPRAHLSLGPVARARESRIGWGLSFASVHRQKSNFQIREICGFICRA